MDDIQTGLRPMSLDAMLSAAGAEAGEPLAGRDADWCARVLELWSTAASAPRLAYRAARDGELRSLVERLRGRLELEASRDPAGDSARRLEGQLGRTGGALVDADALSRLLPQHGGPARLDAPRRARLFATLETLERHLNAEAEPPPVVVHAEGWPEERPIDGLDAERAADPLARASELFDERAQPVVEFVRAVRLARLELADDYDPSRHDAALARFGWREFDAEERHLLPAVAALDLASRVRDQRCAALGALFDADRPIRLLLRERPLVQAPDELGAPCADIASIAAAFRGLFVVQTTAARPQHLLKGLERLAASPAAGVAVIALPSGVPELDPAVELAAAHAGRATPCLVVDPVAGADWATCLELDANPQPTSTWPQFDNEADAFTYAHAVFADPRHAMSFTAIDAEADDETQLELSAYLEAPVERRRRVVPYIRVHDAAGELRRVRVGRSLVTATRERARAWRGWSELAGIDNAHVRRAVDTVRGELEATAWSERQALVEAHEQALAAERATAGQAGFERIVNALIDGEVPIFDGPSLAAETSSSPVASAARPAAQPEEANAAAAAVAVAEIVEAGIDSVLCTTCNECTNLNPRMFAYNADKQAYIKDVSAGTFAELVKAAERCPARCIHPGAPRSGDRSATASVLARAAPFN